MRHRHTVDELTGTSGDILTPEWRNEGIGIVVTDEGKVYATQNFC